MTTPESLRDAGMASVTAHADPHVIEFIDALIAAANECGKPWDTNQIRDQLPECDRHLVGARVRAAAMRRPVEMVAVGEVKSNLNSTHAKSIKSWVGVAAQHVGQVAS